ncbi:MAG: S41 family peptidase [Bacteroidota bacterium]|nr:S41 family peptidase [Bacteroidota bacterium]
MKKLLYTISIITILFTTSCEKLFMDKEPGISPNEIFEQVWSFADANYSFFDYKGINWDSVKSVYEPKISDEMTDEALFDTLANMLFLLRDGHVNLKSDFDFSRNWHWYLDYPSNFSFDLLERNYFNHQEQYMGGFVIHDFDDVGYIYYSSFMNMVNQDDLNYIFEKFENHKGLILDFRNNGGGAILNIFAIANRFTDTEINVAYEIHKNGPKHEDFTEKEYHTLTPIEDAESYTKPVVILTNRLCYSATNFIVTLMRELPNVTIIGDKTGGGGGIPSYTELSNGWIIRVSTSRLFTLDGFNVENGVEPDIKIDQNDTDTNNGIDTILEEALNFIRNN